MLHKENAHGLWQKLRLMQRLIEYFHVEIVLNFQSISIRIMPLDGVWVSLLNLNKQHIGGGGGF